MEGYIASDFSWKLSDYIYTKGSSQVFLHGQLRPASDGVKAAFSGEMCVILRQPLP